MLPASTKLTLLVLALPIGILAVIDTVAFIIQRNLVIELSNLLSAIVVFLLVWERLRESLSKKLEYLNESIFLGLLSWLQRPDSLFYAQDPIIEAKDDLKRHARFLSIALYPRKFLKKLDALLRIHQDFYSKWSKIYATAEEIGKPEKWLMAHYIDPFSGADYPPESERVYFGVIEAKLGKDGHVFLNETKNLYANTKTLKDQIHDYLEEFLKCNNLKFNPYNPDSVLK